jgi:ribosome-binding protein aMBF1 (putative translation factor)
MERLNNCPDFTPVVLRKTSPKKIVSVSLKKDDDMSDMKVKKYDQDFIKKIVNFRTMKGLKQQELAQKIGVQLAVIKGIESNSISYNPSYVQKINNYISRDIQNIQKSEK